MSASSGSIGRKGTLQDARWRDGAHFWNVQMPDEFQAERIGQAGRPRRFHQVGDLTCEKGLVLGSTVFRIALGSDALSLCVFSQGGDHKMANQGDRSRQEHTRGGEREKRSDTPSLGLRHDT